LDYFDPFKNEGFDEDDVFFHEVQFYMEETTYSKGETIVSQDDLCNQVMFVVHGKLHLEIIDDISG
jgi:CRP-like cAMP-binding protein